MQTKDPINTLPLEQFIASVKNADSQKSREIKIDIDTAKRLAFTLGIVMSRLNGDLEKFVKENTGSATEVVSITMDGGSGWKNTS